MALIGIVGKTQVGKDTVGKIIQMLTDGLLEGIPVEGIEDCVLNTPILNPSFKIVKYADKLKDMVCLLIGCTREDLENDAFKDKELGEEWFKTIWWIKSNHNNLESFGSKEEAEEFLPYWQENYQQEVYIASEDIMLTPRKILQLLGTEAGRKIIHPDIWVNATMAEYKPIETIIEKSNTFEDNRLKHGYNKTRIFRIYHNIKQRCSNPNHPRYENYGGKGITVCDEWSNSIDSFINWANGNGYQETLTIDRIDNDKEYSPSNCRWVTYSTQAINQGLRKDNTSGYKGVSKDKHNWRASIQINKERRFLGYFDTAEAASEAYEEAFLERENLYNIEEKWNLIYPSWCITDVRFPNEVKAIKDRGGIIIKINRNEEERFPSLYFEFTKSNYKDFYHFLGEKYPVIYSKVMHESETALDNYIDYDAVIGNSGFITDTVKQVKSILKKP